MSNYLSTDQFSWKLDPIFNFNKMNHFAAVLKKYAAKSNIHKQRIKIIELLAI